MAEGINVTAGVQQQAVQPQNQAAGELRRVDNAQQAGEQKVSAAEASRAAAEQAEISVEQLQVAIDQLNEFMREGQRSLAFSVDKEADEVVVQVRDKETDELIRQIPSPEALELKQHLEGVIGLLFNDKA